MSHENRCPICLLSDAGREHKRLCLAENNGRMVFECDVEMPRGNPYRKGSDQYDAFMRGYSTAREESRVL